MIRIVLMGFMGAGKTTIGKALAKKLGCRFADTDELIEQEQGRTIPEIFEKEGETYFRNLETELLKNLQMQKESFVLSLGGGVPVREENRALLRNLGTVIYLETSKEEIIKRVSKNKNRPLLQGGGLEEKVSTLMAARESIYRETAHVTVPTDGKDIEQLVSELEQYKNI